MKIKSKEKWIEDIEFAISSNPLISVPFYPDIIKRREKIELLCSVHGSFSKTAGEILQKKLCPICSSKKRTENKFAISYKSKIKKVNIVHNNQYDYSLIDKTFKSKDKVKIVCSLHGVFEQVFSDHLRGSGCPKCAVQKNRNNPIDDINSFLEKHDYKYTYKVNLIESFNWRNNLEITCPIHGKFNQIINNHYRGYGCPKCSISKSVSSEELELTNFIKSFYDGEIITSYRPDFLNGKEIDIYIPEKRIGIEFNGLYWHSEDSKNKKYHFEKTKLCLEQNINLLHIWSDDFVYKKEIVLSKIKTILGYYDKRIFARKTYFNEIDFSTLNFFMDENHLEGMGIPYKDSKYYGIFFMEELIGAFSYGLFYSQSEKIFKWKLQRIAFKKNYILVGGMSKVVSFIRKNIGNFIYEITLDTGGKSLGFYSNFDIDSAQLRYWWTNGKKRISRNQCQSSILSKNSDWKNNDTENSYMKRNGFLRIWDSGILKLDLN